MDEETMISNTRIKMSLKLEDPKESMDKYKETKDPAQKPPSKLEASLKKVTLKNTLMVASGASLIGGVATSAKKLTGEMRAVKEEIERAEINESTSNLLHAIHVGSKDGINDDNGVDGLDGKPSKYVVYSHTKKMFIHGDDYAECMRQAYTKEELLLMVSNTRTSRRIQAYGAVFIIILSLFFVYRSGSIAPLFSIFPAMMLVSFALRRACFEMSIETLSPATVQSLLNQRGLMSIWK